MVVQVHCRAWAVPVMLPHLGMVISQVDAIGEVEVGLAVVLSSHGTWCICKGASFGFTNHNEDIGNEL
jgi:hypothetical protein